MPKKPIDYSKGFIYRLVCKDLSVKEIYVGSSTNFRQRKAQHKCSCTKEGNRDYYCKVYEYIRNNGGWDNWDMVLLEKYPCNDKYELTKRERYWTEELKASLNSNVPSRTQEEYYEEHKEYLDNKKREWEKKNYEKIKEKRNTPEGKERKRISDKKYRDKNIDKIKEYDRKRTKKSQEQNKQKITCSCGLILTKGNIAAHRKTKKHQNYIQSIE